MADRQLYGVRLGAAALLRGERLICEVLGVLAQNAAYVRVRIVYSTLSDRGLQAGRERMVRRDSLVPVQAADRAAA